MKRNQYKINKTLTTIVHIGHLTFFIHKYLYLPHLMNIFVSNMLSHIQPQLPKSYTYINNTKECHA